MTSSQFSVILNISIPVRDFAKAITFYASLFEVLGAETGTLVKPQQDEEAALSFRWGRDAPSFTVVKKRDTTWVTGVSFTLRAPSENIVDTFYEVAIDAGATSDLPPAQVQMNGLAGYMCTVFDLDGNELNVMYVEPYREVVGKAKETPTHEVVGKAKETPTREVVGKAKETSARDVVGKAKETSTQGTQESKELVKKAS
ncbi:hypothetical protein DACRYDRAFT_117104 [Dacryopinax primogenitus]|uniref:VOC domain-containing protein n=1 Tax=Dacryopinax primogenitus (strain DJM 731) TaxID=1858805 RepID=M5FSY3_DACPD|nr:uncharacterized protein DACRYDRAFT_117104 [Dacryopinax primogenitus]EJU00636.1 hypothetical protein DACRYDRAFT_117104 [Dacryopinax primogenitus]